MELYFSESNKDVDVREESVGFREAVFEEDGFLESIKDVQRMILRDINHPSIIMWGTRINESRDDDEFYIRIYKAHVNLT